MSRTTIRTMIVGGLSSGLFGYLMGFKVWVAAMCVAVFIINILV